MRNLLTAIIFIYSFQIIESQSDPLCNPLNGNEILSQRLASYEFDIEFDYEGHKVSGTEKIIWKNSGPDSVGHLRMYMYVNAFKNNQSSYLRNSGMNVMGQGLANRKEPDWGWIEVHRIAQDGGSPLRTKYVQPNDGNEEDQTVLHVDLIDKIAPGEIVNLELEFTTKLPRIISRVGFAEHGHHHFVHWYPKLGVYEADEEGNWDWNCHQFLPQMEFYGDHGNYLVKIRHADFLTLGGSGCIDIYKEDIPAVEGMAQTIFHAMDVIDFGWVASPLLEVYEDQWEHVNIRLLSPKIHKELVPRFLKAAKSAMSYMTEHVGPYPYRTLTILDPPVHGLRSGFMEYPTYITGGAFYKFPKGLRSMESLIIHEYVHQYFMQILASNEKESPWLDEGFVTFYEDCVMEDTYGKSSLFNLFGYNVANSSFTRNEYASLPNKKINAIDTESWNIRGSYKGIVYSKTATFLQTLKRYIGEDHFDEMMKSYFEQYKFTHPRKENFFSIVKEEFERHPNILSPVIDQFLQDVIEGTAVCDYGVQDVTSFRTYSKTGLSDVEGQKEKSFSGLNSTNEFQNIVSLERKGDLIVPVDVVFTWDDGTTTRETWDGKDRVTTYRFRDTKRVIGVHIDPERKLFLDIDFNNNSWAINPDKGGIWKYATRTIYWVQNTIQSAGFLM